MDAATDAGRLLRFGIMCDGPALQEWQVRCVDALLALEGIELRLLIVNGAPSRPRRSPGSAGFPLFLRVAGRPASARRVDVGERFAAVPSIRCEPVLQGRYSQHLAGADIEVIRGYGLDFILRFGFGIIRGGILSAARYGVWSFHHGDLEAYRGMPAAFWEIVRGDPVTGAVLQRLTDRLDGGVVLRRGYLRTRDWSYAANLDQVLAEGVPWPAQVCVDIRHGNAEYLDAPPARTSAPVYRTPDNLQMLAFLAILARNILRRLWRYLFRHMDWTVGIAPAPISAFLEPGTRLSAAWLRPLARGQFLADPFGVERDGRLHLLVEEYEYATSRGVISRLAARDGRQASQPERVLELPVHLSYPYLFEHEGTTYCVPETAEAREVSLYAAERFPDRWCKVATLLEGIAALDSTIFPHGGRWWLLCTDGDGGSDHRLLAYHAPDPLGPWTPHANNPVKVDARSSRPAGTPFVHQGVMYRPAQDVTHPGGVRVAITRIVELSETRFAEEVVRHVGPIEVGAYRDGVHTLAAVGNCTVLDAKRYRLAPRGLARNAGRIVRRTARAARRFARRG